MNIMIKYIEYQDYNSNKPYNYNALYYKDYVGFPHLHSDYELIYVIEGNLTLTAGYYQGQFSAGEAALILPNQVHYFSLEKNSLVWIAVFAKEYVPEFHKMHQEKICPDNRIYLEKNDSEILLQKLICHHSDSMKTALPLGDGVFSCNHPNYLAKCAMLNFACASYMKTRTNNDFIKPYYQGTAPLLHQILTYIQNHYREDITLRQMSKSLGYEEYYVSRCFNNFFHKNFKQFINERRIHSARYLLAEKDSELTMTDIAYQCGFQSVRNFNRVFRNIMGYPPSKHNGTAEK